MSILITTIPQQGRWHVYGLYLPDDVLQKIYLRNAENLLVNKDS
jgi:hypothetical protein